jgi:hypothetical protein
MLQAAYGAFAIKIKGNAAESSVNLFFTPPGREF